MQYSEFPKEEYLSRYHSLIKEGLASNIDAFIFTDEENLRYFAGGPLTDAFVFRPDYMAVIIPTDEHKEPAFVMSKARIKAADSSWVTQKFLWSEGLTSDEDVTVKVMVQVLKKLGLQSGRIGMEVGKNQKLFMPIRVYEGIRSELPEMDVVSSFTAVAQVRTLKSAEEITCIRRACNITAQAIEYGLSIIQKGITEKEIYRAVKKRMFELGADKIPFLTVIAGWEGRSICWDSLPTNYKVKAGDTVQIDGGCSVKGYLSDMVRTGSLGEPKLLRFKKLYNITRDAHYAIREQLGPDTPIRELCRTGRQIIENAGYGDNLVFGQGQTGHGFGLSIHEAPFLSPQNKDYLKPGMVLAIEPAILENPDIHQSSYYTILENNYLITEDGYEQLTNSAEEIRIIPL